MSQIFTTKAPKQKVIFHVDGDAFFVGVEVAKNPKLKGQPVVTGEERGIVSALSYEAKAIGIKRGMPIFRVKKDFPQVTILPGDYKAYVNYSGRMFDIVRRYIDDVEEYSIDECFGDLTGLEPLLKMTYKQIAERIKKEINQELDISVSIGIAPTKVLAKVASKWVKPNGLTVIEPDKISDFLSKTPVDKIWGIGPRSADFLKTKRIYSAKDFIDRDENWIKQNLSKPFEIIWRELRGESIMKIDPVLKTVYDSIQKTRSFHPATNDKDFLLSQLSKHVEEACLKARYYKLVPKQVSFFLKDKDFKYSHHTIVLPVPTNTPETIVSLIQNNFNEVYRRGVLYRTAGVTLQKLMSNSVTQPDLFGNTNRANKFEKIHQQLDKLEEKLGKKVVYLGSTDKALKKQKKDNQERGGSDSDDLDRDLLFL